MGAFKDRTGKTRVGSALASVGGFFSNIFKKKSSTTTPTTPTTPTPKGATQGINGNTSGSGSSFWSELAVTLGTAGLAFLGSKVPSAENPNVSVYEQQQIEAQYQEDAKDTGSGIFVIIGVVILAVIGFFYFRTKK